MNGSIAIGSRRTTPTWPTAAAVVSDDSVAPRKTPCCQSRDSVTSGTVVARRPPNRIAEIGTPLDRKSTRLNSSHVKISYAVFCLKKKKKKYYKIYITKKKKK